MVDALFVFCIDVLPYLLVVAGLLLFAKLFHFKTNKSSSWKAEDFLYFSYRHKVTSYSNDGKRNKEVQNVLTKAIVISIIAGLIGLLLRLKTEVQ